MNLWIAFKVVLCFSLLWNYYELKKLDALLPAGRSHRFINKIASGFLVFVAARLITVMVDIALGVGSGIAVPLTVHGFFIYIGFVIRGRRKKLELADQRLSHISSENELDEVLQTLQIEKDNLVCKAKSGR